MRFYDGKSAKGIVFLALFVSLAMTPGLNSLGGIAGRKFSLAIIVLMNLSVAFIMFGKYYNDIFNTIFRNIRRPNKKTVLFILILALVFITLISLWRAPYDSGIYPKFVLMPTLMLYSINILIFAAIRPSDDLIVACIRAVLMSAPIFAVLNLLIDAYLGNVPNFLSIVLSGERITSTAFFSGANSSAIFHGFALICSVCLLSRRFSYFCAISALVSSFYLLMSQSKGMMAISAVCIICLLSKPVFSRGVAILSLAVWPVSSLFLLYFYRTISGSWLGDMLSRSEGAEYGVATGRPMIWESAWYVLERQYDLFWVGIGFASASRTAVILPLGFIFNSGSAFDLTMRAHGLHNAALQINFDMGLVGLIIHFIILIAILLAIIKTNCHWALPIFIYIVLAGFNEAVGTYYQPLVYFPFIGLLILFLKLDGTPMVTENSSAQKSVRNRYRRTDY